MRAARSRARRKSVSDRISTASRRSRLGLVVASLRGAYEPERDRGSSPARPCPRARRSRAPRARTAPPRRSGPARAGPARASAASRRACRGPERLQERIASRRSFSARGRSPLLPGDVREPVQRLGGGRRRTGFLEERVRLREKLLGRVELAAIRVRLASRPRRPAARDEAAALLRELGCPREQLLRLLVVEPRTVVRSRELDQSSRSRRSLRSSPRGDLELLVREALGTRQVALPPGDLAEHVERLEATRCRRRSGSSSSARWPSSRARGRSASRVERDLGERRRAPDPPTVRSPASSACVADGLHLQPRRRAGRPSARRRWPRGSAARAWARARLRAGAASGPTLFASRASARLPAALERFGCLGGQLGRTRAVELGVQRGGAVEMEGADLDELVGASLRQPGGEPPVQLGPRRPSTSPA